MIARTLFRFLLCVACVQLLVANGYAQLEQLAAADQLLLRGNYAESEAAFEQLLDELPTQATLGLSRCNWQQGKIDQATKRLESQLLVSPDNAKLLAQRAWFALHTGDWGVCAESARKAIANEPDNALANWVQAELLRATGKVEQAQVAYRQQAEYFDRAGKTSSDPRDLHWFAKALAQHARWNQDTKRFRQLTTQLYPRILSLEPNYWPAHHETGKLLLEKFNASDAESAFNDALQINPSAADVHASMARLALNEFQLDRVRRHVDRALQSNPHHVEALLCQADMHLASLRPKEALLPLETARDVHPNHAATLGRLSATHFLLDQPHAKENLAASKEVLTAALGSSSHGEYYAAEGAALEHARRYPKAGASFRLAIESTPQLLGPHAQLGMIEMRLGHEPQARELLEESFRRDPYNVRVKNQLEVLDLLDSYATIETEHFVVRYDPKHDKPLARHMSQWAEACYRDLTETFDFQLPEKALLEVFHDGQGVKAREWFGARMVGLPNIHTIAACGGNIVAMVSPTAERRRINWADILRHEIVHLINVQQTEYAVPHWLTEGCAVWQENRPRRTEWDRLLARRVPKGDVFNLDSINLGFLKPRSADDWHMAYCQAELYIDLIARDHGVEGVRKLLAAHRDNLPTAAAIATSLGTTQEHLEETYAKELAEIGARLSQRHDLKQQPSLPELTARWQQNPTDWDAAANLALARLRRGDYPGAGQLANQVVQAEPNHPIARLVKAKLLIRIGDQQAAAAELETAVGIDSPLPEALKLLAGIHLRQGNFDKAKRLYLRGAEIQPENLQWTKALAIVALRQQDSDELNRRLLRIANAEPDNLVTRKKLLQLAQSTDDRSQISKWANEILHIDPNDSTAQQALSSNRSIPENP